MCWGETGVKGPRYLLPVKRKPKAQENDGGDDGEGGRRERRKRVGEEWG